MDLKKLVAFPDQYLYWPHWTSSSRRKVVSGFGLGLVASLFVLSVVFLNFSFKASLLSPVLQGFNVYFSRAKTAPSCNASGCNASVANKFDQFMFFTGTLEGNVSRNGENMESMSSGGAKGEVFQAARLGNISEEGKKESFALDGEAAGILQGKFHGVREAETDKNGSFPEVGNASLSEGNQTGISAEENFVKVDTEVLKSGKNAIPEEHLKGREGDDVGGSTSKEKKSAETTVGTSSRASGKGFEILENSKVFDGDCDIYNGRWVRDESKPYYPPGSCPHIDRDFDCHLNKRPDDEYVKWRWKPYNCDIPSLNATDFLERLRGQKLVFVGDSLNRNMWESLVCILRQSIQDKSRVYEISGRHEFKKKGFYAFRFEDYNCSVDFVSSPFLVRESSFQGKNGSFETLRLDLMDKTTAMYHDADVLIFNTGHWWTHEKTSRGEDYYQEGNHVHKRLKVLEAYKRALGTWARWVDDNVNVKQSQVIFRGYSVTHFRGGPWNSGGQCHKETEPIYNETHLAKYPSKMRALENILHQMKTPVVYLNISRLTDFRKDGHPSIYRKEYKTVEEQLAGVHSQDCSHWCLPGVPDTWNELLYASLLKTGRVSWRS